MEASNRKRLCYHASEKQYRAKIDFARTNRSHMTPAETALWQHIRKQQLDGHRFRRQHMIGRYIVDFVCLKKALVIEVNGEYHYVGEQERLDEERRAYINERGFRLLVFTNEQVFGEIEKILHVIRQHLNADGEIH